MPAASLSLPSETLLPIMLVQQPSKNWVFFSNSYTGCRMTTSPEDGRGEVDLVVRVFLFSSWVDIKSKGKGFLGNLNPNFKSNKTNGERLLLFY